MRRSIYRLSSGGRGGEGLGWDAARKMMRQRRVCSRCALQRRRRREESRTQLLWPRERLELGRQALRVRRAMMTERRAGDEGEQSARARVHVQVGWTDGVPGGRVLSGRGGWRRRQTHVLTAAVCGLRACRQSATGAGADAAPNDDDGGGAITAADVVVVVAVVAAAIAGCFLRSSRTGYAASHQREREHERCAP